MRPLEHQLRGSLERLEREHLLRHLRPIESEHGACVSHDHRRMLMLSSNNYLGLAAHPEIKRAAVAAIERYGVGAGASRLTAGSLEPLHRLEANLAKFKRLEAALVFGSGYLANIGVLTALVGRGDAVFSDQLNHASLIDGCRLSGAELHVYRHCDPEHLEAQLKACGSRRRRLVVTDSVFSMDGDFAPLDEIVELVRRYEAAVMIDEAHAIGVVGPGGAGLAAELGLEKEIDVQVGTLSKALGAYGAYVAGSRVLIEFLVNRARSFIYTTGLAPALAAAADAALNLVAFEPERIERLWDNASYLRRALSEAGFRLLPPAAPILPVIVGDAKDAVDMSEELLAKGVYVIAIRPPSVPEGMARLRVTPTADHSRADLDRAAKAFIDSGRKLGLI